MKKQTKIIIGIMLALVVVIVAISFMFPTVFKGLTSGTFGKADKYHKTQMTEKDIMLRSELLADTGQLRNMIQGLIYFSLFTQDLRNKIDSCVTTFEERGICSQDGPCTKIRVLQDYSDFIKNNNKTLSSTISLLTAFYLKDETDESADVEKNLRDFGNYVNNLNEKDSILEQALQSMDHFMLTSKTLKARKTELANLKSIRDQLLVKGVQLAGLLQDKPLCSQLLSYALSSQAGFNAILSQQTVGVVNNVPTLNVIFSQQQVGSQILEGQLSFGSAQQLNEIIQAQQLGMIKSNNSDLGKSLVGAVVVYNKADLQFVVSNVATLQNVLSSAQMNSVLQGAQLGNIQGIAVFSQQGLNLVQSAFDLKSAYQSVELGSLLNSSQLGALMSQQSIGSACLGSNFIGVTEYINSVGLGMSLP